MKYVTLLLTFSAIFVVACYKGCDPIGALGFSAVVTAALAWRLAMYKHALGIK